MTLKTNFHTVDTAPTEPAISKGKVTLSLSRPRKYTGEWNKVAIALIFGTGRM